MCSFKGEAPIQWIFLFYESSFLVLNVKCSAFDMCHYMVECSLVFWAHFLVLPTSYKGSIRATEGNDEELHVQKISCQLSISHWSSFLDCYCCDLTRECLLSRFRLWRDVSYVTVWLLISRVSLLIVFHSNCIHCGLLTLTRHNKWILFFLLLMKPLRTSDKWKAFSISFLDECAALNVLCLLL